MILIVEKFLKYIKYLFNDNNDNNNNGNNDKHARICRCMHFMYVIEAFCMQASRACYYNFLHVCNVYYKSEKFENFNHYDEMNDFQHV